MKIKGLNKIRPDKTLKKFSQSLKKMVSMKDACFVQKKSKKLELRFSTISF